MLVSSSKPMGLLTVQQLRIFDVHRNHQIVMLSGRRPALKCKVSNLIISQLQTSFYGGGSNSQSTNQSALLQITKCFCNRVPPVSMTFVSNITNSYLFPQLLQCKLQKPWRQLFKDKDIKDIKLLKVTLSSWCLRQHHQRCVNFVNHLVAAQGNSTSNLPKYK